MKALARLRICTCLTKCSLRSCDKHQNIVSWLIYSLVNFFEDSFLLSSKLSILEGRNSFWVSGCDIFAKKTHKLGCLHLWFTGWIFYMNIRLITLHVPTYYESWHENTWRRMPKVLNDVNLTVSVQLARTFKIWDQRLIFFFCSIAIMAIAILLPRKWK